MKRYSLDDLALFVNLCQYSSLSEASREMAIPVATLSRRLKQLEEALDQKLIDRSSKRFALTPAGKQYLESSAPLLTQLHKVHTQIETCQAQLEGTILVTAPVNLTSLWLKYCILAFSQHHPEIRVQLHVEDNKIDLYENEVDIAFRVGDAVAQDWVARPLWKTPLSLFASKDYLGQHPDITAPSQLADHRLVSHYIDTRWLLTHQETGERSETDVEAIFNCNDYTLILDAIQANLGIGLLPPYYANRAHVELIPVLPEWHTEVREIKMMYRQRKNKPARIQAFIDHVLAWHQAQPLLGYMPH
ncbi:LysR family transcriptional regulator [Thaumasiovibrio subtropicus]|uniref:LysR family transcriptional regulator n=1 Tax=Thaumasiovibrio subtropicus TaxID=1891207 RepID=UPI000B34DFFF|nr:LysR family transcriptional regulator [Thaumasiovibrio subtropicus]